MSEQYTIPPTLEQRMHLRRAIKAFVQMQHLCPPVSLKQLEQLAETFIQQAEQLSTLNSQLSTFNSQLSSPLAHGGDSQPNLVTHCGRHPS